MNSQRNKLNTRILREPSPESMAPEPEYSLPRYERRNFLSLLIIPIAIVTVFVVIVAAVLFIIFAVTHSGRLPALSEMFVNGVTNLLLFGFGFVVPVALFITFVGKPGLELVLDAFKGGAEVYRLWIHAHGERDRNKVWGLNQTHAIVDGKASARIESTKERNETYHIGETNRNKPDPTKDLLGDDPAPRTSAILEQLRNGRYGGNQP